MKNKFMNQVMGMESEQYDKEVSKHSKANIFLWLIGGVIFNIYVGNLISVSTFFLFIPGIFIISFASIPTFYVEVKKRQIVPKTNNFFVLLLFTIWYLIDIIYPIALSIGYIYLAEYLFKFF